MTLICVYILALSTKSHFVNASKLPQQAFYLHTKFRRNVSIHAHQVRKTNGRHWNSTFGLDVDLLCHRHVILQWPTEYYASWMIAEGLITSYWFYKTVAIASQIYFRFPVWPRLIHRKAQSYRHTKFWSDISIHGRHIITSGFWKLAAAVLKFYFRFRLWPFHCHRRVIFYRHTKFHPRQSYYVIAIFKAAAASHVEFGLG